MDRFFNDGLSGSTDTNEYTTSANNEKNERSIAMARMSLTAVTIIAAFVIFIYSIRRSHRHGDPARSSFLHLRVALCFFFVSCLFEIFSVISGIVGSFTYSGSTLVAHWVTIGLTLFSSFFWNLTDILIIAIIVRLSTGIKLAKVGQLNKFENSLKHIVRGVGTMFVVVAIADIACSVASIILSVPSPWFEANVTLRTCILVGALCAGVCAIKIKRMTARAQPSTFLVVCASLFVVHAIYELINTFMEASANTYPDYMAILDLIFSIWTDFVILSILFVISIKTNQNGVWSVAQPTDKKSSEAEPDPWGVEEAGAHGPSHPMILFDPQTGKTYQEVQPQIYHQPLSQVTTELPAPPHAPQEMCSITSPSELSSDTSPILWRTTVPVKLAEMPASIPADLNSHRFHNV